MSAFLEERFDYAVSDIEAVGEGAWSRCFGFRRGGAGYVIRFGDHPEDFAKDRRAFRFRSAALPIPEVTETGEALGRHYAVSERVFGTYLERLDAAEWQATLPATLGAIDAMRSVDLAETSGYGGWGPDGTARHETWPAFLGAVATDLPEHRTYGWTVRLAEMSPSAAALLARGADYLDAVAADLPDVRSLGHGDLLNRNVLAEAGRITGVLDWGCSFYGDFLYDVAWLEFWAPWHPNIAAADSRAEALRHFETVGVDVPGFSERMQCCLVHIGLDHLAYNAYTGDGDALAAVAERTAALL